jgi:retinol dehydrogenase-12
MIPAALHPVRQGQSTATVDGAGRRCCRRHRRRVPSAGASPVVPVGACAIHILSAPRPASPASSSVPEEALAPTRDLVGRTVLVTGANAGIGRATAEALCARGARVHLACRSETKTKPVLDALHAAHGEQAAAFLPLDLGDFASVRAAAQRYLEGGEPLHVLIHNAGLAGSRGTTKEGHELTFGTNHLGPFLFNQLLLERVKQSAPARIVWVSSKSHRMAGTIRWDRLHGKTRSRTSLAEYAESKLANILTAKALASRLQGTGVMTYALHPGVVASDIWRDVPVWLRVPMIKLRGMVTNEEGARTSVWCATEPSLAAETGHYYADCRREEETRVAKDEALAEQLWAWSLKEVGLPPEAGAR